MTAVVEFQSIDAQIGERVHQLMFRRRLSQTVVAPFVGVGQGTLSRKLRGEVAWSAEDVIKVAAVLAVEPAVLLPRLDSNQQPSD